MKDAGYDGPSNGSFVIDKAYFRDQAREAAKTFVAPLAGVYRAISPHVGGSDANGNADKPKR